MALPRQTFYRIVLWNLATLTHVGLSSKQGHLISSNKLIENKHCKQISVPRAAKPFDFFFASVSVRAATSSTAQPSGPPGDTHLSSDVNTNPLLS